MKAHYYEVDLMRACIILGVVCEHLSYFFSLYTVPLSTARVGFDLPVVTFHFTREAFMFITGLVLFITYYRREFHTLPFWLKRFKLIVIPYIVWNIIYLLFGGLWQPGFNWQVGYLWHALWLDLLTGNQFFLYYLVISMQLYIVFPLLLRLIKWTEKVHSWVFGISFAVQIGLMALNKFWLPTLSVAHWPTWLMVLVQFRDRFILTYQFWFIAGAIVAVHYPRIRDAVLARARLIGILLPFAVAAVLAHFVLDYRVLHESESQSVLVLQPIMIPYSLLIATVFWVVGLRWAAIRTLPHRRRLSACIQFFSKASFGIFLVHPIALVCIEFALGHVLPGAPLALRLILLPCSIAVTYVASGGVAHVLGNIPYVSYVVGQRTDPPASRPAAIGA
ncbi:MAG: acyltransferase [Alicyclobacillus sp.]|nr:acyltransferase [Alicyclobacillus sp.]